VAQLALLGVLAFPLLGPGAAPPVAAEFLDAVLAEVGTEVVTASDVALTRALGAADLAPGVGPITAEEVSRVVDARLMVREAVSLDIAASNAAREEAWRAAGLADAAPGAGGRLARLGVSREWARQVLADELRRRRFIDVRFRSFAFVSEFDVDDALGPGAHPAETREATRRRLLEAEVAAGIAEWLREARERAGVRLIRAPVPLPFTPEGTPAPAPGAP
jgi:hypothetical protein